MATVQKLRANIFTLNTAIFVTLALIAGLDIATIALTDRSLRYVRHQRHANEWFYVRIPKHSASPEAPNGWLHYNSEHLETGTMRALFAGSIAVLVMWVIVTASWTLRVWAKKSHGSAGGASAAKKVTWLTPVTLGFSVIAFLTSLSSMGYAATLYRTNPDEKPEISPGYVEPRFPTGPLEGYNPNRPYNAYNYVAPTTFNVIEWNCALASVVKVPVGEINCMCTESIAASDCMAPVCVFFGVVAGLFGFAYWRERRDARAVVWAGALV